MTGHWVGKKYYRNKAWFFVILGFVLSLFVIFKFDKSLFVILCFDVLCAFYWIRKYFKTRIKIFTYDFVANPSNINKYDNNNLDRR